MSEDYFESFCNRMRKLKVEVQRISSANARLMGERLITASDNDLMRVIRGEINYDIDRDILRSYLHGKRVLVTGAGGSIGSELCRQISEFGPETLMMLDHDETLLMETRFRLLTSRAWTMTASFWLIFVRAITCWRFSVSVAPRWCSTLRR